MKKENIGSVLLKNWEKREKQHVKEIRNSKDFNHLKNHMKILAKK